MSQPLPITIMGTYEGGVLRLDQPLEIPEGARIQVTVGPLAADTPLDDVDRRIVQQVLEEDHEVFDALAE
jgi:predicted DNA-binding antitoxin AbrB/MazE fold protein